MLGYLKSCSGVGNWDPIKGTSPHTPLEPPLGSGCGGEPLLQTYLQQFSDNVLLLSSLFDTDNVSSLNGSDNDPLGLNARPTGATNGRRRGGANSELLGDDWLLTNEVEHSPGDPLSLRTKRAVSSIRPNQQFFTLKRSCNRFKGFPT